jgi:hypothetical protein
VALGNEGRIAGSIIFMRVCQIAHLDELRAALPSIAGISVVTSDWNLIWLKITIISRR